MWKFKGKIPDPNPGHGILCEPAQSNRTWTFHKIHVVWKFTGNWPDTDENTSVKHRAPSQKPFSVATHFVGKYRSNSGQTVVKQRQNFHHGTVARENPPATPAAPAAAPHCAAPRFPGPGHPSATTSRKNWRTRALKMGTEKGWEKWRRFR